MVLDFARTRSDATVQREGTEEELEVHKRRRTAEKEKKQAASAAEEKKRLKRAAAAGAMEGVEGGADGRPAKRGGAGAGLKSTGKDAAPAVVPDEYLPPNKILFVRNLPERYTTEPEGGVSALTEIFGKYDGFREVRLVPGRNGIAFVEYESESGAVEGKQGVGGMLLGGQDGQEAMKVMVTYQRQ